LLIRVVSIYSSVLELSARSRNIKNLSKPSVWCRMFIKTGSESSGDAT
jgi:hypothetical protein